MKKALILSGAGLSAESGIQTFRGGNGLWDNHDVNRVCNINAFEEHRNEVFAFFNKRRQELASVKPNRAHIILAALQQKYGVQRILLATQNGDDLLERAGAPEVRHVHGKYTEMVCRDCRHVSDVGYASISPDTSCTDCGTTNLKPNVVFFGEDNITPFKEMVHHPIDQRILTPGDLFIVIGTSGMAYPIDILAEVAATDYGLRTVLANLEPIASFDHHVFTEPPLWGPITKTIGQIENMIKETF